MFYSLILSLSVGNLKLQIPAFLLQGKIYLIFFYWRKRSLMQADISPVFPCGSAVSAGVRSAGVRQRGRFCAVSELFFFPCKYVSFLGEDR